MSHIIITGATGSAGSAVLNHAIASPAISKISVLSRRPVKLAESSSKTNVIIHEDFEKYSPELLAQLKGATGCIWAQGISTNGMSEPDYIKITVDYPLAAAKAFAGLGEQMNFVYLSGEGADMQEKSWFMYGRIKGRAEHRLLEAQSAYPSLRVFNARPAVINPQGKYLAERPVSLHDRVSTGVGAVLATVWKNGEIATDRLAKTLLSLATGNGEPVAAGAGVKADGRVLGNTAIRRLADL